jgi:hypothetical protein
VADVARAALFLAGTAFAGFCLRRAWQLGRGGIDAEGRRIQKYPQYVRVRFWGALGIGAAAFVLLGLADVFKVFAVFDLLATPTR